VRILPVACIALLAGCASAGSPGGPRPTTQLPLTSGEAVVRRMHEVHHRTWYRTLTFVQRTTFPGRPVQTWYEAAMFPGKLRIDIAPLDSSNATMYVGDSIFLFRAGRRVAARPDRNLLLTLGFDVYGQPPETTIRQLTDKQVDLGKVHEGTWQGRPVFIVGAAEGDTTSNQFWVDAERMLFVRLIEQSPAQNDQMARLDIEFNKYVPLARGWIAPEVVVRRNGEEIMREEYSQMRADVELDPALFATTEYRKPGWVK
jgi:hypothetical protein